MTCIKQRTANKSGYFMETLREEMHDLFYYRKGQIVNVLVWNKYSISRNDIVCYYQNGKVLKFSKGEAAEGSGAYAQLEFEIYYRNDKELKVSWLIPKPKNVISVDSDIFLKWAYSFLSEKRWN